MSERRHGWAFWMVGMVTLQFLLACGKRCKEPVMFPYPAELHTYMDPYKPGAWWVYENSTGLRDSVYLTTYNETFLIQGDKGSSCFALTQREFSLRTVGMDSTGYVHVSYSVVLKGEGGGVVISSSPQMTPGLFHFSYTNDEGYGGGHVIDTTLGAVAFTAALRADRAMHVTARQLEAILLARDIGIVGYITNSDTFTLSSFHIP